MIRKPTLIIALCAGLALTACDDPAKQQTDEQALQPEPLAGPAETTDALPEAQQTSPSPSISGDLAAGAGARTDEATMAEGSMAEDSPAGAAVTEQELPQSDLPPPPREEFTDATCDFEEWVGKPVAEAETAVKETGRTYRILKPDSMMTMDHNPDRINVVHGEDGIVTRVWCG